MSKKTKSSTPAAPATGAPIPATGAAAAATPDRGGDDLFKPVIENGKPKEPTTKLAPQALVCLNVIRANPSGVTRKVLVEQLVPGGLKTKQPAGRILSYYQKDLINSGAMTLVKAAAPAAPAAAAPAAPAAK